MGGTGNLDQKVLDLLRAPNGGRPFVAGVDHTRPGRRTQLTVHAASASMTSAQSRRLSSQLSNALSEYRVTVKRHPARTLSKARSLEDFLSPFRHEQLVFDPTGVFVRSTVLINLVKKAREIGCDFVEKCLWHSPTGTLYVVFDHKRLSLEPNQKTILSAVEYHLRKEAAGDGSTSPLPFLKAIRLGYHEPNLATVPVDSASVDESETLISQLGKKVYISSLAASLGFGISAARAQDTGGNQAVYGPNAEVAVMGGTLDDDGAVLVEAATTQPLGDEYGLRLDGVAGSVDGEFLGGAAAHLFWRDPNVGLFGVAAGYLHSDQTTATGGEQDIYIVAGEAEAYFDRVTLSGMAGYLTSDTPGGDGFVGRVDLEWYPDDDVMLAAGVETNPQRDTLGRLGIEYRPSIDGLPGLSVFAEGAIGEEGYSRAFGGIRYYFGPSVTLKDRHRRDTFRSHLLPNRMIDGLEQAAAYGD